ncbi:MAG: DUF367 family protein [Desulfurococcales archaeon]|nr:DUF367 family protein [Desulfurococcales archaeon]
MVRVQGDDPKMSTALKLVRLGLAVRVSLREVPRGSLILDPTAEEVLTPGDRSHISSRGITVIDSSWNRGVDDIVRVSRRLKGFRRVLPALKAGNPINYAVLTKLSSAEAVAAALYITGFKDSAREILSKFKWGRNFLELNKDLLERYSKASSREEVLILQREFLSKFRFWGGCRL